MTSTRVGSSSIRFWRTLKQDFPDRTVINRGFGGSTVWEVDHYFDRVVAPYKPKEIVFYDADHEMSDLARRDRIDWLALRLKL